MEVISRAALRCPAASLLRSGTKTSDGRAAQGLGLMLRTSPGCPGLGLIMGWSVQTLWWKPDEMGRWMKFS